MTELLQSEILIRTVRTFLVALAAMPLIMYVYKKSILQRLAISWGGTVVLTSVVWGLSNDGYIAPWLATTISGGVSVILIVGMARNIRRPLQSAINNLSSLAKGNINIKIDNEGKHELRQINDSIQTLSSELGAFMGQVNKKAKYLNDESGLVSGNANKLTEDANMQATSIEELSATMEEMAGTIASNLANSMKAKDISEQAKNEMAKVVELANEMVNAAALIKEKITVVTDIATQTNILALNASIEANRAGEAGKGFSVVAGEVRKLAAMSQQAAEDITTLTNSTFDSANNVADLINKTISVVDETSGLVNEISSAASEQQIGASQINNAIQQLNAVSQKNAAASDQLTNASLQMESNANELKNMVARFS